MKLSTTAFFLLAPILLGLGSFARAEKESGDAVQIAREVDLRREASSSSPSLGRLPKGTIATFLGDEKNGFVLVGVELEKGNIEGWVPVKALDHSAETAAQAGGKAAAKVEEAREQKVDEEKTRNRGKRRQPRMHVSIPKDEGALLRRETTFFYGIYAGGNVSIMNDPSVTYSGVGFDGGVLGGFYLWKDVPVRFRAGYTLANGVGGNNAGVDFGFLTAGAEMGYQIERFEFFGGLQYDMGISVSNVPATIVINGPSNLSNFYGIGGVGYRIPFNDVSALTLRARYSISTMQAPVVFQFIGLTAALEFNG